MGRFKNKLSFRVKRAERKRPKLTFREAMDLRKVLRNLPEDYRYKRWLEHEGVSVRATIRKIWEGKNAGKFSGVIKLDIKTTGAATGSQNHVALAETEVEAEKQVRDYLNKLKLDIPIEREGPRTTDEQQQFKREQEKLLGQISEAVDEVAEETKGKFDSGEYGTLREIGMPRRGVWVTEDEIEMLPSMVAAWGEFKIGIKYGFTDRDLLTASEVVRRHNTGTLIPKDDYIREMFIV